MSEQDELERLQRQLDAAFASTRPRRGFEDELWARLGSRPPAVARRSLWGIPGLAAAGGVAVVLLAGITLLTLVLPGGRGGQMGGASSPGLAGPAQRQAPAAPNAQPFGPLPAPPGAGVVQVMQGGRLSPVPAGVQMSISDGALPQPAASLRVFRYDPASGPPGGAILEPDALPPNLPESPYPTRQPGDAFVDAAGRGAAANQTGQQAEATLTQARLVYVAVVAGGQGYLEPAYLFTGTYRNGGAPLAAQVLVPALAASALR
ncbi:MAG TPA: hypothetical protein VLW53_15730 [Candidatus Eisenbacteria bacterium]|nr:hypothetical protein [Candidatus Eisenbacteria bacterium]